MRLREREGEILIPPYTIVSERKYVVEGTREDIATLAQKLAPYVQVISEEVALLGFGNAVGTFDGSPLGTIVARSRKLSAEAFQEMVQDIASVAGDLPFQWNPGGGFDFLMQGDTPAVLYHIFALLKIILPPVPTAPSSLLEAVAVVMGHPYEAVVQHVQKRPVSLVGSSRPAEMIHDFVSSTAWIQRTGNVVPQYLPAVMTDIKSGETQDTAETRFVKWVLERIHLILQKVSWATLGDETPVARMMHGDAERMIKRLSTPQHHPFWQGIGMFTRIPQNSSVLQHRAGYREVFALYREILRSTRVPLDEEVARGLLHGRDIADLYELWTYFQIVDAMTAVAGPASKADVIFREDKGARVRFGYSVQWSPDLRVLYNSTYSPTQHTSYSVPLRPDVSVDLGSGGLHLFDAKFRFEFETEFGPVGEQAMYSVLVDERRGRFVRGDLYKMHAYRDAIPGVHSVWICYPGTERRFYPAPANDKEDEKDNTESSGNPISGVGAIPLIPGEPNQAGLRSILEAIVSDKRRRTIP